MGHGQGSHHIPTMTSSLAWPLGAMGAHGAKANIPSSHYELAVLFLLCYSYFYRFSPIFTDFSDFLGRIFLQDYYFTGLHVFFQESSSGGITSSIV